MKRSGGHLGRVDKDDVKDNDDDSDESGGPTEVRKMKKAPPEVLARREILRVKPRTGASDSSLTSGFVSGVPGGAGSTGGLFSGVSLVSQPSASLPGATSSAVGAGNIFGGNKGPSPFASSSASGASTSSLFGKSSLPTPAATGASTSTASTTGNVFGLGNQPGATPKPLGGAFATLRSALATPAASAAATGTAIAMSGESSSAGLSGFGGGKVNPFAKPAVLAAATPTTATGLPNPTAVSSAFGASASGAANPFRAAAALSGGKPADVGTAAATTSATAGGDAHHLPQPTASASGVTLFQRPAATSAPAPTLSTAFNNPVFAKPSSAAANAGGATVADPASSSNGTGSIAPVAVNPFEKATGKSVAAIPTATPSPFGSAPSTATATAFASLAATSKPAPGASGSGSGSMPTPTLPSVFGSAVTATPSASARNAFTAPATLSALFNVGGKTTPAALPTPATGSDISGSSSSGTGEKKAVGSLFGTSGQSHGFSLPTPPIAKGLPVPAAASNTNGNGNANVNASANASGEEQAVSLARLNAAFATRIAALATGKPVSDWSAVASAYVSEVAAWKASNVDTRMDTTAAIKAPTMNGVTSHAATRQAEVTAPQSATTPAAVTASIFGIKPAGLTPAAASSSSTAAAVNPFAVSTRPVTSAFPAATANPFAKPAAAAATAAASDASGSGKVMSALPAPSPFAKPGGWPPVSTSVSSSAASSSGAASLATPSVFGQPTPSTTATAPGINSGFGSVFGAKPAAAGGGSGVSEEEDEDIDTKLDGEEETGDKGPIALADGETVDFIEPRARLHWLDASEKRYKDMGIGCVRVISRTRTQEDGTTAKVARFVFALPAPAGKGRDKILVNAALYKGLRFSASGGGDGPPPALTLDMYINKSVGDANTSKLERYMVKVKSSAQQDAIVAAMAPYV